MTLAESSRLEAWPDLPLDAWADTYATLHMWLQIAGKVRLALSPWLNHSWHATLYPTATGLTTGLIPYATRSLTIDFDFVDHRLVVHTTDGGRGGFALEPQSVASFYRRLMHELALLDVRVDIHMKPNEVPEPIRFDEDETHDSYDAEYVTRFWQVLIQAERVFTGFRTRFIGKCSPVHLFWGAPDLAVTRFSGRRAPLHPGGVPNLPDPVSREAYSHEVSSCGFWAGGGTQPAPVFYSYAYPEPAGLADVSVKPADAYWNAEFREFMLPYDAVRLAANPDDTLLEFLQSTYEAVASLAQWDRAALEQTDDPRTMLTRSATSLQQRDR
jgi:hypothetical protein